MTPRNAVSHVQFELATVVSFPCVYVQSGTGNEPVGFSARLPPSTGNSAPVTIDAASDTRNSTGPTISRGSPMRPIGIPDRTRWTRSALLGSATIPRQPAFKNWHGWMPFTRMPWCPHSTASSRVSWLTPLLLAPHTMLPRPTDDALAIELTLTTLPP